MGRKKVALEKNSDAWNRILDLQKKSADEGVQARAVVDDAHDPGSPLHEFFNWNNAEVADEMRLHQARALLRQVTVTMTTTQYPDQEVTLIGGVSDLPNMKYQVGYRDPRTLGHLGQLRSIRDDVSKACGFLERIISHMQGFDMPKPRVSTFEGVYAILRTELAEYQNEITAIEQAAMIQTEAMLEAAD